jgi:catechol 2,3-dioxygenase-like lactoylglutathione lyase family enzyme
VAGLIEYEQLHHVSLAVEDLQACKQFYREVLGLQEIKRPDFDFPGAWFQVGERQQLHLIVHPGSQTLRGEKTVDSREGHFAVRVKCFEDTIDHLERNNVSYKAKPNSTAGFPQIYCCDPDGNLIEFNVAPGGEGG